MDVSIRKLDGANMDIDLATPAGKIQRRGLEESSLKLISERSTSLGEGLYSSTQSVMLPSVSVIVLFEAMTSLRTTLISMQFVT